MLHFRNAILLVTIISVVDGSPLTMYDDRVRGLDVTPALGRGYNVGTNKFHSACHNAEEKISPTYNYDYSFADVTRSNDVQTELTEKFFDSFGYDSIKTEFEIESKLNSQKKGSSMTHNMVVATMRIERDYSSMKENVKSLSYYAKSLLTKQDYVGFFKFCGTNYVRSIRRAHEITTIFKFQSASIDRAEEFAAGLKVQGVGNIVDASFITKTKFSSILKTLEIEILGFGLGLNQVGSTRLFSSSVDELNEIIKFAFTPFTENENNDRIGMFYGLELVPWVDNAVFQKVSGLVDDDVETPLPRSLIPKAIANNGESTKIFINNNATRTQFSCMNSSFNMDRDGYCCDNAVLFNYETREYEREGQDVKVSSRVCKPHRKLDKSVLRNNMSNNGEFVARLDSIVANKKSQLFKLGNCLASLFSFVDSFDYYILEPIGTARGNVPIESKVTIKELKMAIAPLNDNSLLEHMEDELDEFMDMFYQPCISALFGTDIGTSPDAEPHFFMASGWMSHDACSKLSCLAENMRWNRDGSGCIPSLIAGNNAPLHHSKNNNECKEYDMSDHRDGSEECKNEVSEFDQYENDVTGCWRNEIVPAYLMDNFCEPQISDQQVDEETKQRLENDASRCI